MGYKLLPEVVSEKVKQKLDSVVPPARYCNFAYYGALIHILKCWHSLVLFHILLNNDALSMLKTPFTLKKFFVVSFFITRELSQVLDGRAEPSDILFTNGKTTLLLPAAASSSSTTAKDNSNGQIIPNKYAGVTINTQGKKSLVPLSALVSVQHLCEQVDCNKPLFGK